MRLARKLLTYDPLAARHIRRERWARHWYEYAGRVEREMEEIKRNQPPAATEG